MTDLNQRFVITAVVLACAIVLFMGVITDNATAYQFNETNLTEYQSYPFVKMPVDPLSMMINNGTGQLNNGYLYTITKMEGVDIIIELLTIITVLLSVITVLLVIYVGLYIDRYLNGG